MSTLFRSSSASVGMLAGATVLGGFAATSRADTIIYDSFSNAVPAYLENTTADQVQTPGDAWNVSGGYGRAIVQNGVADFSLDSNQYNAFAKGYLPFNPTVVTSTFTLSADLSVPQSTQGDTLIGFVNDNTWNNGEVNTGPLYAELDWGGEAILGVNGTTYVYSAATAGLSASGGIFSANIGVQFNPTTDVATLLVNGAPVGTPETVTNGLTVDIESVQTPTDLVGFKVDGGGVAGDTLDNFLVSTAVPEPTSLFCLAAAGIGGVLARRRRA